MNQNRLRISHPFGQLKGGIKKAIERAKELPNDNKTLTHELGTSVSILIDKLFTL